MAILSERSSNTTTTAPRGDVPHHHHRHPSSRPLKDLERDGYLLFRCLHNEWEAVDRFCLTLLQDLDEAVVPSTTTQDWKRLVALTRRQLLCLDPWQNNVLHVLCQESSASKTTIRNVLSLAHRMGDDIPRRLLHQQNQHRQTPLLMACHLNASSQLLSILLDERYEGETCLTMEDVTGNTPLSELVRHYELWRTLQAANDQLLSPSLDDDSKLIDPMDLFVSSPTKESQHPLEKYSPLFVEFCQSLHVMVGAASRLTVSSSACHPFSAPPIGRPRMLVEHLLHLVATMPPTLSRWLVRLVDHADFSVLDRLVAIAPPPHGQHRHAVLQAHWEFFVQQVCGTPSAHQWTSARTFRKAIRAGWTWHAACASGGSPAGADAAGPLQWVWKTLLSRSVRVPEDTLLAGALPLAAAARPCSSTIEPLLQVDTINAVLRLNPSVLTRISDTKRA